MRIVIDTDDLVHDVVVVAFLVVSVQVLWISWRATQWAAAALLVRLRRKRRAARMTRTPSGNELDADGKVMEQRRSGLRLVIPLSRRKDNSIRPRLDGSPEQSISTLRNKHSVTEVAELSYTRPSSRVRLEWVSKPSTILIMKKWNDPEVTQCLEQLVIWLSEEYKAISLLVDLETKKQLPELTQLKAYENVSELADKIDLIICLGGDGTVLHVCSLFQQSVPPIMAFKLGSMGFLAPFNFKSFKDDLRGVLKGKCFIKLRLRLHCTILKNGVEQDQTDYHALNEATIDRGNSSFLSQLDCYCDDRLITTVQADGIIVATATGSTAYSLSSGGSLVHPLLPAVLFTPICPHSLSFRPVVLPSSCILKVMVPPNAHCPASVSFDGKVRHQLQPGDGVLLRISTWPVATVVKTDQIAEWFHSLARHLNWNKRVIQKAKKEESLDLRSSL